MAINADKPHLWKNDIASSVDMFNAWFMKFAPKAYRETRVETTKDVQQALRTAEDLRAITALLLKENPQILPTLRMSTCPPLARDRLIGLAGVSKTLVNRMEKHKCIPPRMNETELEKQLLQVADIISQMLDEHLSVGSGKKTGDRKRTSSGGDDCRRPALRCRFRSDHPQCAGKAATHEDRRIPQQARIPEKGASGVATPH